MENADEPELNSDFDAQRVAPDDVAFPDDEGDLMEACLNTPDVDDWQRCLPEGWGVFPHDGSGQCYDSLLVRVDGRSAPIPSIFDHVIKYLERCPRTQRVMFYLIPPAVEIPDFLNSWRRSWIFYRDRLERALPEQSGGAPVLRVSVRDRSGLGFFLSNGRPAGGQKLFGWWRAALPAERGALREAVRLVANVGAEHALNCSFVGRYANQPAGLNGINVLTFGGLGGQAMQISQWRMRIYLTLNAGFMPIGITEIEAPRMMYGQEDNPENNAAVAVNMADFYRHPFRYLSP